MRRADEFDLGSGGLLYTARGVSLDRAVEDAGAIWIGGRRGILFPDGSFVAVDERAGTYGPVSVKDTATTVQLFMAHHECCVGGDR